MVLPNLEEILNKNNKEEVFLALKIETNEVKSAVWSLKDSRVETLAIGERAEWGEGKEELMVACDSSIATAITNLGQSEQAKKEIPRKMVLGLPSHWVKDNKILPDKSNDIQFLTKKLSLSALGFVVIPEAIAYFLKNKEKDFSSAVLIYLGTREITVSLINEGKSVQSEVVGRSDNLALDVEEGVLRFPPANLPAKILLYNSQELEEARQTLISYPWQPPSGSEGKPGFLHLPRVEILPSDLDIQAVIFAGGEELKKSRGIKEKEEKVVVIQAEPEAVEVLPEPGIAVGIGFVKGEDIAKKLEEEEVPKEAESESVQEVERVEAKAASGKPSFFLRIRNLLAIPAGIARKIFHFLSAIKFKKTSRPEMAFSRRPPILPRLSLFLFIFLLAVLAGFYFFARAEVILTVAPQVIEKEVTFKIDNKKQTVDLEGKILPVKALITELTGSKSSAATGKKTVGEKAKGEIIVYNRTDSSKRFNAGTVLVGPGKLRFTLDTEAIVASKTPDLASGIDRWGEAKANITAVEIGTQYNIATGSQFNFEDLSAASFLAKNQVAFLGGTSRQIVVVAKEDQEKLLADLTKELRQKAEEELKGKLAEDESFIPESVTTEIKVKKFSQEVMDESSDLSLNLVTENKILVFKKNDLVELSLNLLAGEEISGAEIQKEKTEFIITKKPEGDSQDYQAKVKIFSRPVFDSGEIISKIVGRPFAGAEKILLDLKSVKSIKIKITPALFKILPLMPLRKANIKLDFRI